MDINSILEKNKDIKDLSNFKTPAIAKFYFEINSKEDINKLSSIYNYSKENNLGFLFIGGGTNLLFAFDKFEGVIIKNCLKGWNYNKNTKILEAGSREVITDIAESLYNDGQVIWKRFIGLPGSVGGAVFGNAGCFGLEIENNFLKAEILNLKTGDIFSLSKEEMDFEYRNSIVKKVGSYFIINVSFDLNTVIEKYSSDVDNLYFREYKQPKGNTCGSFFKNPSRQDSAGSLIEKVGLKGYKLGGAYFSDLHANFLMNDGTSTYKDLLELIKLGQKKVKKMFNIDLVPEVRIITNNKIVNGKS